MKKEQNIGFIETLKNKKVIAIEARRNNHVSEFIEICMLEEEMQSPIVINCREEFDMCDLIRKIEPNKSYILENIEDVLWAKELMDWLMSDKNTAMFLIILKRSHLGTEGCHMVLNGETIFYPEIKEYEMFEATNKVISYFGRITPKNYYKALRMTMREGAIEGRNRSCLKNAQYGLGMSMRDRKNIEIIETKEDAILYIKSCDRATMAEDCNRKELAKLLNTIKPLGKQTIFSGNMCKKRAVQHIENYMRLHNREWGL